MAHPVYERLLERFCAETVLDVRALREMIAGERAADPLTVRLMQDMLDVPKSAWVKRTRGVGLLGQPDRVSDAHRAALANPEGRRRKHGSAVHRVIDRLDWKMGDLAEAVSKELGRPISRPTMQNYAAGIRSITHRGEPKTMKVTAPLDVREAAERITLAEAHKRKLGKEAILRAADWPNVGRDGGE